MGRKTKLTPTLQARLCAHVTAGASIPAACGLAGISWNTVKDWLALGREGKAPYAELVEALEVAKNAWAGTTSKRISNATKHDWKAGAWILERRLREFAPPTSKVDIEVKSADYLRTVLSQVRARAAKGEFEHLTKDAVDELLAVLAGKR